MTGFACGRRGTKLCEPVAVLVVFGVAVAARGVWLGHGPRFVARSTSNGSMFSAQVEFGSSVVIETNLLESPKCWRMTLVAATLTKQLAVVGTLVTLLAIDLFQTQVEFALRVALETIDIGVRTFNLEDGVFVVIELSKCCRLPTHFTMTAGTF